MEQPKRSPYGPIIALIFAAALFVAGGIYLLREPKHTTVEIIPPQPTATDLPTATPAPLEIYVTGAVQNPQARLTLPIGSRVEDAIAAAGGALENADLDAVNLAQRLQDGDMIFVPTLPAEAEDTDGNPAPTPNAPRVVNINEATLDDLDALPGIGPTTAQAIIDYRTANGPFESIEELLEVEGIGEGTLNKIRDYVTVEP
ncbi:MAG: helix-hairpin-helix domain-containing protein [Chloroflexi bacterium]|nr:helix-hairpin-helix domain-containing protein [Chloroflexota bacterium]